MRLSRTFEVLGESGGPKWRASSGGPKWPAISGADAMKYRNEERVARYLRRCAAKRIG